MFSSLSTYTVDALAGLILNRRVQMLKFSLGRNATEDYIDALTDLGLYPKSRFYESHNRSSSVIVQRGDNINAMKQ